MKQSVGCWVRSSVRSRVRNSAPAALAALALVLLTASVAWADPLVGQLTDGLTGAPIAGASVRVLGTELQAKTDALGRWEFDVPPGVYELELEAQVFDEVHRARLVNEYVPQFRESRAYVFTSAFVDRGYPALDTPMGAPSTSGKLPDDGPQEFDLRELWPGLGGTSPALQYTIPANQPATIRVGRRRDSTGRQGCTEATNPVVAIEEMSLDEYVKGVLPPEIGVFQSITGASEVYKAFAIAAKSYGLYFILRYGEGNRRTVSSPKPPNNFTWFHIDDTACNQRYENQRLTITNNAADAVARKIMVKKGATTTIDKYEYAASCGKHGTRPHYQTAIKADRPPTSACAGSWCGHNNCAAHEDNPNLPAGNRCLVRGICQWGSASWGENGRSYTFLLEHYQPNTVLTEIGNTAPDKVVLTGYVHHDPSNVAGSGISGATVRLNDGQTATTNASGVYRFDAVALSLGTVTITASHPNYATNSREKDLEAGVTNWGSIALVASSGPGSDPDPEPEPADVGATIPDAGVPGDEPDAGGLDDVGPIVDSDIGDGPGTGPQTPGPGGPGGGAFASGKLIAPSSGVDGGCAAASGGLPALPPALLALLGLVATTRRRRAGR